MSAEFKVGDVVRLIGNYWSADQVGTEKMIEGYSEEERAFFVCDDLGGRWYIDYPHVENSFAAEIIKPYRTLAEKRQDDFEVLDAASEKWRSPDHYKFPGGVQVIDITRHLSFPLGNVVKYVSRAGKKGPKLEDLEKALKYLTWAIEDAKKESE